MASSPTIPATRLAPALLRLRRYAFLIACVVCFTLALALRLYRLDAQSLWLDEGNTWAEVTRRDWLGLLADLFSPNAAYPLYHLLLKAWIAVAGDSEWALRFPSALAGAGAALALMLAAAELETIRGRGSGVGGRRLEETKLTQSSVLSPYSIVAGLLFVTSPFALWHAQEAKVYSLLMFVLALALWAVLRALRLRTPRAWLLALGILLAGLFVHRLAVLAVAGVALALALVQLTKDGGTLIVQARHAVPLQNGLLHSKLKTSDSVLSPQSFLIVALACAAVGVYGLTRAVVGNGWQESGHIAAGPLLGLWLSLAHFSLDRGDIGGYAGLPLLVWALPSVALALWGLALLVRDARRGHAGATVVLCIALVPLALFALALAFSPIFEARYAAVAFPAWLLVLAYPFHDDRRPTTDDQQRDQLKTQNAKRKTQMVGASAFLLTLLVVNALVLLQPKHGLFSGAPVKEEWRAAVTELAGQLHPDDLLIVHPYYTQSLWDYYAPRVTPDPLPKPVVFTDFSGGDCIKVNRGQLKAIAECYRRRYDVPFNKFANGKKRAVLLIAPNHAATIDRPKTLAELLDDWRATGARPDEQPSAPDAYGWVGLRFQFTTKQRAWPCFGAKFVGLEIMCQSYPSAYGKKDVEAELNPAVPLPATFGGEIMLRGYSLDLFGGKVRPGGSLPITLYWQALKPPSRNYSMFLHLCRDCDTPPLAGNDRPPLDGYAPAGLTTTWQPGDPVHDERTLPLPADLPPGRYTLLLGVRPADADASDLSTRLPVDTDAAPVQGGTRLVLGTIEVSK